MFLVHRFGNCRLHNLYDPEQSVDLVEMDDAVTCPLCRRELKLPPTDPNGQSKEFRLQQAAEGLRGAIYSSASDDITFIDECLLKLWIALDRFDGSIPAYPTLKDKLKKLRT
jgi:hypothetical protein